ncbi:sulfatase [Verrucomicrobiaceae bacterium N1E253]|uniref:Sulfatase n=1 Tax=Oceaniferula marina TaxID=2748318 RepID=A0A851GHD9_9BACT|nr:sulfatase [Oceaniferula marina]NWK56943.1 sulfatase [Oceaniferula marina]
MKRTLIISSAVMLAFITGGHAAQKPNIIFMLSDDQSWNGLSVAMHPEFSGSKSSHVRTPNLEKLAASGLRFSSAYAPASVCSPTRIALQTGKSPAQLGWTKAAPTMTAADGYKMIPPTNIRSISKDEVTVAELLKTAGYATAHYGKWHINGGGPEAHGYDESDGETSNKDAAPFKDPNPVDIFGMASRAQAFMAKNHKLGKPFFIQMSFHALHYPENARAETLANVRKRNVGGNEKNVLRIAIAEDLDAGVGKVLAAIDKLGIADNTYVIYMSDNGGGGGGGMRDGLSGGKGSVWEGGIRVPLIIAGPGIKGGGFNHQRVIGQDFLPTFCELAGVKAPMPKGVEGGSFVHLLHGERHPVKRLHEELVFHFPHYQSSDGPHTALILGDIKLIKFYETGELKLFDLSKDLAEKVELSEKHPEQTEALNKRLNNYLRDVGARLPVPNPNYDPSKPPQPPKKGKKGKGSNKKKNLREKQ